MKRILNIGCAATHLENLPEGWEEVRADIDDRYSPDIVVDARDLSSIETKSFDAIYASHIVEHVYPHEVLPMLRAFHRIAKSYVQIRVPDLLLCAQALVQAQGQSVNLYVSEAGPVTPFDLIYGYAPHIKNVSEFYAHKTGFTGPILVRLLQLVGFKHVNVYAHDWELEAIAEHHKPLEIVDTLPENVRRLR